ncbi:EAL domain-containing protein [Zoogloea sp.]|uniref:sensor domain-containing protein n=1 Tax=Zoogloea sp. TaxID=49181 RepID=UPI0031FBDA58
MTMQSAIPPADEDAADAREHAEHYFRALVETSPLGVFAIDAQGICTYANPSCCQLGGPGSAPLEGRDWRTFLCAEDRPQAAAEWKAAAQQGTPFRLEARWLCADGSLSWVRLNAAVLPGNNCRPGHVLTVEDISERKAADEVLRLAEEALFAEKERAQVTLNSIGDAVLTTDMPGKVTYMNLVAEKMTGWSRAEALGRPLSEVFHIVNGLTREAAADPARRAMAEDRTVELATDCVLVHRDGSESSIEDSAAPIHNRDGRVSGAVIVFHDVSESRAMAARMSHLAHHDFLTGLPNRALLTERLSQAIGLARRRHKQVALLFLDVDYFKHINDSLGHRIGDLLLQALAERLIACVRTTDTVCRQGGDEFVILLSEVEHIDDATRVAEKLLQVFSLPQLIDGHELHVTLSIGISVYPDDGDNAEAVMQNADTAMYHAKARGRNNCQLFRSEMNTRAVQRQFIESGLRRALKQGEFLLYYQPKIDLHSGTMTGAEALIRWQDPMLGLIQPAQFVPIAEESGLIVPIGRWVMREACRQLKAWQDAGLLAVPVSVNISAVEFRHKSFLEGVALILSETGLSPELLELELTESILMQDAEASALVLTALKTMGMQLAIDDFGTGYSSLSYLKRFPIDTLKIDQSFVHDVATDADDATIVSAMIGMGRSLKQRVVAEGVETQEQLAFLRAHQCHDGQGFQFSEPLCAEDFRRLLGRGSGEATSHSQ